MKNQGWSVIINDKFMFSFVAVKCGLRHIQRSQFRME